MLARYCVCCGVAMFVGVFLACPRLGSGSTVSYDQLDLGFVRLAQTSAPHDADGVSVWYIFETEYEIDWISGSFNIDFVDPQIWYFTFVVGGRVGVYSFVDERRTTSTIKVGALVIEKTVETYPNVWFGGNKAVANLQICPSVLLWTNLEYEQEFDEDNPDILHYRAEFSSMGKFPDPSYGLSLGAPEPRVIGMISFLALLIRRRRR